jgi:hypothetical protein
VTDNLLVVARRQSDNKVIVSRFLESDGSVEWTYALDFTYNEPPMLIDFKDFSGDRHFSLATRVSSGGFSIARLQINSGNLY